MELNSEGWRTRGCLGLPSVSDSRVLAVDFTSYVSFVSSLQEAVWWQVIVVLPPTVYSSVAVIAALGAQFGEHARAKEDAKWREDIPPGGMRHSVL